MEGLDANAVLAVCVKRERTWSTTDKFGRDCLLVSLELLGSEVSALIIGARSRCWRGVGVSGIADHGGSAHPSCARGRGSDSTQCLSRLAQKRHVG